MSAQPFRVAAVQTVSGGDVEANLRAIEPLVVDAARRGARLILLPEYFGIFGARASDKVAAREADGAGMQQSFLSRLAREYGIWIIGGTVPIAIPDPARVRSAALVYGPDGERVARYDKIHLFAFNQGAEHHDEGRTIEPGTEPVAFDAPCGRVALSVCYDVRFPELYRALAPMDMILVPSAFTATTGRAHWETLLRARAIENLAWVIAPAQGGRHANGRETHGHTMIVDPWGKVVGERPMGPGLVVVEIDPAFQARMRVSLPALTHRVF
jgi:nitrilase